MDNYYFKWTDELVKEFAVYYKNKQGIAYETWGKDLMNEFIKSKEHIPLFITEDGVAMYEGDVFWYVNTNVWLSCSITANNENIEYAMEINKYKTYSTKELAEQFLLYNKPVLSLSDFENKLGRCATDKYLLGELKQLAQSKINNK